MKNVVTIIAIFVLFSCSGNVIKVTSIMLPDNMELLSGNYRYKYDGITSEVRMIAYYDSTICSNCVFKNFSIWTDLINTFESYNYRSAIVFIFAPRQSDIFKIKSMIEDYVVDYPVYIDTAYYFSKVNPEVQQQFFGMIDQDNHVILSGYPFDSSKKQKQYIKIFKSIINN